MIVLLVCLSIIFVAVACKKTKYPSGKDTIESFGDGKFQISKTPSRFVLINEKTNEFLESNIYRYKEIKPFVYIIGESGYLILNYETGEIKKHKKVEYFSNEEIKIFNQMK